MKLLRYGTPGREKPGLLDARGRIRDLSAHVSDIHPHTTGTARVAELAPLDPAALPLVDGRPRLGPPVGGVGKVVAIGLNYSDHAKEAGQPIPAEPVVFTKAVTSIIGPNDPVMLPQGSLKTDWEVELGVIIGTRARYVQQANALEHVAGYCVVNDV